MIQCTREKINFMLDLDVIRQLKMVIPDGERSTFVNEAVIGALSTFRRKKACEEMDKLRKKANVRMSTAQILKAKDYGRK